MSGADRTIAYQPALDGLRAVAVGLVLVFHGGFAWMSGGYVGVSVFFTLSGYLITSLLLVEHDRTGRIDLGRFYARRMKRLLPASLLCLGAVAVAAAAGAFDEFDGLRRDLLGALFQVANWVKLLDDASYADLTNATLGRVAPLEHYWSLAIEEQFYWVWPLVLLGVFRVASSARSIGRWIVGMTMVGAAAAPLVAITWGPDAAYWATPARIGEILVGAWLASVLHRRGTEVRRPSTARALAALAPAGLVVVLWAALTWPAAEGPAYEGWLPAFALASAAVVLGLQYPSPVRTALSWRPIGWTGTISYGLYLYHWPLFAVLTSDRVGVDGWALFGVRLAVTFAVAALSSALVEQPVRRWNPTWSRPLVAGGVATVALAVVVVVGVRPADTFSADANAGGVATIVPVDGTLPPLEVVDGPTATGATGEADATPSTRPPTDTSTDTTSAPDDTGSDDTGSDGIDETDGGSVVLDPEPVPVPALSRPVRILTIGDSTSEATAVGFASWAIDHPDLAQVTDASVAGCGFVRGGVVPTDGDIDWQGPCDELLDVRLPELVAQLQPDVLVLMVTMRDVEDRIWSDAEGPLDPFDPRFRERLLADYRQLAERLAELDVPRVAWVLAPHPIAAFAGEQRKMLDLDRYRVQFDVIREVAAGDPDRIRVIDLQGWLDSIGRFRDGSLRPDGLHWTPDAARWVVDRYLAGSVVTAAVS